MAEIRHILTTTDFSPASRPGIETAVDLAKTLGARLTLVHVFDPAPLAPIATRGDIAMDQYVSEQEVEKAIQGALDEAQKDMLADLPNARTTMIEGHDASAAIDEWAGQNEVDLIVVSTHGRTGLAHFLIGSVAEKVLRKAPCPVLTVPSKHVL